MIHEAIHFEAGISRLQQSVWKKYLGISKWPGLCYEIIHAIKKMVFPVLDPVDWGDVFSSSEKPARDF